MSAIIDGIPLPILIFQRRAPDDLVLIQSNSASIALLGGRVSEGMGKTVDQLFPGRWGAKALSYFKSTSEQSEPVKVIHRVPGLPRQRVFITTLAPQTDSTGSVSQLVVTQQDASLFLLNEMRTRAIGADARSSEMGRLVSLAAHDLRAPMRNIRVISELLREDFKDLGDGKVELIDMLEKISDKSLTMVTSILNAVSIASKEQQQHAVSLPAICSDLRQMLDPIGRHDIQCDDVSLYVDDRLLRTVTRNLIDNAIKHGGDKSLQISINVAPSDMPDMLRLTVADNGSGFDNPDAVLDACNLDIHINGFGLSTMETMLRGNGGSIDFMNATAPDQGAIIIVTIPGAVSVPTL